MKRYISDLVTLVDTRTRGLLAGLFALMVVGSVLDAFSLSLVFPILRIALGGGGEDIAAWKTFLDWMSLDHDENIAILLVGLAGFFIVKNALLLLVSWLQNSIVQRRLADFTTYLFTCYLGRDYSLHMQQNSAEIVRNLTASTSHVFVNGLLSLLTILMEGLLILGAVVVLLAVDVASTLIAGLVIGVSVGGIYLSMRRKMFVWGAIMNRDRTTMIKWISQSLSVIKEVKLMSREDYLAAEFEQPTRRLSETRAVVNTVTGMPRLFGEVGITLAIVAIILFKMSQGQTVADALPLIALFAAAGFRVLPSAGRIVLAANNIRISEAPLADLLRDYRQIEAAQRAKPPAAPDAAVTFDDAIECRNVSYAYPDQAQASLVDITLRIPKGKTVAIVGYTGSGKTTLANLILGLLTPTQGGIYVDGTDLRTCGRAWFRRIGYVPQQIELIDDEIRKNIALGVPDADIDDGRVMAVVRMAQIEDLIAGLDAGLKTVVGERGVRLSGGERQRLGIARALYHDPDVLVLDEATSALDAVTERNFTDAVDALRREKTLIVIAHRMSTVRRSDKLFLLDQGRLVAEGTYDGLLADSDLFRRFVETDMEQDDGKS